MAVVYAHEVGDHEIPLLLSEHGDGLQIELRYGIGKLNGCTFHRQLSMEEVIELERSLCDWILKKYEEMKQ